MNANHGYVDALVDSFIAGGAAVIGLMAGTAFGIVRADPAAFFYSAGTAFGVAFFVSLQAARGRRKPSLHPPP